MGRRKGKLMSHPELNLKGTDTHEGAAIHPKTWQQEQEREREMRYK